MKTHRIATALVCALALTAGIASTAMAAQPAAQAAAADLHKLSEQGSQAFREIGLARLAIFDAKPAIATQLVTAAQASLKKARADGTAFTKAESELRAANGQKVTGAGAEAVAWLPVDGKLSITDEITGTPAKQEAVAKANAHLKKGERIKAIEVLKLADINVAYTLYVAPMDKTIASVDKAAELLKADKYYEANEVLKQVQDDVRVDWLDANAAPAN